MKYFRACYESVTVGDHDNRASVSDDPAATRSSLIHRLRNWEDHGSWQSFFDTYWKLIYSVALKSGLTDQESRDVVQETVVAVAKQLRDDGYDHARRFVQKLAVPHHPPAHRGPPPPTHRSQSPPRAVANGNLAHRHGWPASAAGSVLQSATTLADGGNSQNSSLTAIFTNAQNVVTMNPTSAAASAFLRLRQP